MAGQILASRYPHEILRLIVRYCDINDYFALTHVHPSFRKPVYENLQPMPSEIPLGLAVHLLNNQHRGSFAPAYTYEKFCTSLPEPVKEFGKGDLFPTSRVRDLDNLVRWKEWSKTNNEEVEDEPEYRERKSLMRNSWERNADRISKRLRNVRRLKRGYGNKAQVVAS